MPKKFRWYHGLLFLILVNFLTFAWVFTDVNYYNNLQKPDIAPPSWVFGPIWLLNAILVITGNIWTLNASPAHEENIGKFNKARRVLLSLQGFSWLIFVTFSYLSFGLKSPVMFFIPTFGMWILTVASIYFGYRLDSFRSRGGFWETVGKARSIAFSFTTLILWLSLASFLGFYIWLNN